MEKQYLVGPFFYIQGKIYLDGYEIEKANQNLAGKFDGPGNHKRLYSHIKPQLKFTAALHPYEYWPRGRVVFNQVDNIFEISLDECIKDKQSVQTKIIKAFHLEGATIQWGLDGHYLCHRCNPFFTDID